MKRQPRINDLAFCKKNYFYMGNLKYKRGDFYKITAITFDKKVIFINDNWIPFLMRKSKRECAIKDIFHHYFKLENIRKLKLQKLYEAQGR